MCDLGEQCIERVEDCRNGFSLHVVDKNVRCLLKPITVFIPAQKCYT